MIQAYCIALGAVTGAYPEFFALNNHAQHILGNALGHQVRFVKIVVLVAQEYTVRIFQLPEKMVSGGQAFIIQFCIVALDAERLRILCLKRCNNYHRL